MTPQVNEVAPTNNLETINTDDAVVEETAAQIEDAPEEVLADGEEMPEVEEEAEETPEGEEEGVNTPPVEETDDFIESYEFSEDADLETLNSELDTYLEKVEVSAPVQAAIDRYKSVAENAVNEVRELKGSTSFETTQKLNEGIDSMLEYAPHPIQSNILVPKTEKFRELLKSEVPEAYEQFAEDILSEPSAKYQGQTRLTEIFIDGVGADSRLLNVIDQYRQAHMNGEPVAAIPIPSFVPEGIQPQYADAFWNLSNRDETMDAAQSAYQVLSDPNSADWEKQTAQQTLNQINSELKKDQNYFDQQKLAQQNQATQTQRIEAQIENETRQDYFRGVGVLQEHLADTLQSKFADTFGESTLTLTNAIVSRISVALGDDEMGMLERSRLQKEGVKADWESGKSALDEYYTGLMAVRKLENQIKMMEQNGSQPRAIENTKRAIENKQRAIQTTLKNIKGMQKELLGQLSAKLVSGESAATEKKIANAPKVKAVRPKGNGGNTGTPKFKTLDDFWDSLSAEEAKNVQSHLKNKGAFPPKYAYMNKA